jgi:integral membrane sensor domain MASE1
MEDVGNLVHFSSYLVYFMAIYYILWAFGIFSPVLACCTKKNLATLNLAGPSFFINHDNKNKNQVMTITAMHSLLLTPLCLARFEPRIFCS